MKIHTLDHLVLVVTDVAKTCAFYQKVLGVQPKEHPAGKWALHFGNHKISLQQAGNVPEIAQNTTPGSGNFCVLTDVPIQEVAAHLTACGISLVSGPERKEGARGPLISVYFYDLDGNLVEVSKQLSR